MKTITALMLIVFFTTPFTVSAGTIANHSFTTTKRIYLVSNAGTGNQTWTVPMDWNASNNTIECIGAGGDGGAGTITNGHGASGGGGGAYAKVTNVSLTTGSSVSFAIGAHTTTTAGTIVNETYFGSAASSTATLSCAFGKIGQDGNGSGTATGGAGGLAADSTGDTEYAGGSGGTINGASGQVGGTGGGGAAGPVGAGKNGGNNSNDSISGGTGGGGSNGGSSTNGTNGSPGSSNGTNGGAGTGGGGGGVAGTTGTSATAAAQFSGAGGGGGGGSIDATNAGSGSASASDKSFRVGIGAGGGGGGGGGSTSSGAAAPGGSAAGYGGGGGGGGSSTGGIGAAGTAAQGIIVITYLGSPSNTSNASFTPANLKNGLVGWWTFDGKNLIQYATDSSGQGNHGKLVSFAATTTTSGPIGQALTFDGTDDSVSVPQNGDYTLCTQAFSISVWFKNNTSASSLLSVGGQRLVAWYDGSCSINLGLSSGDGVNRVVGLRTGGSFQIVSGGNLPTGWNHVTATYDGVSAYSLYVNGVSTSGGGAGAGSDYSGDSTTLYIGQRGGGGRYYTGGIDDLRIYSRALSATEITQLYNLGSTRYQTSIKSVENGLVGWWTFDGKNLIQYATDSSGQGNHGKLTNFTSTTTAVGPIGQALRFDGTNDYVSVPDNSSLSPTTAITLNAWVKLSSTDRRFFINKGSCSSSATCQYWLEHTGSVITFDLSDGTTDRKVNSSAGFNDDKWHHIVGTYDGATQRLYVDGVANGTPVSWTGSINTTSSIFSIGSLGGANFFWNGTIDDVRVYNRALSAAEVLKLYNLGR